MIDLQAALTRLDALATRYGHPGARVGVSVHAVHDERTRGTYAEIGLYVFVPELVHVHAHKTLEAAFADLERQLAYSRCGMAVGLGVDLGDASAVRLPGEA